MRNNKQFLWIGAFVIAGIALIIAILLWFSASNRKSYNTYRIIFHESVDGVTTSSIVKYNGVEVGKVHGLELDPKDPSNIYVDIDVLTTLPISTNTYATVKPQGVTGMSYVALAVTAGESYTILKPHNSLPYPEIQAKTSFLTNLTEQAQKIGDNIGDVSNQVKLLLNDKNVDHVNHILANIDRITGAVANQSENISQSIEMVGTVLQHVDDNATHLNDAIVQLTALSKSLQSNSATFDNVMNTVQNNTLRNINTVVLPNLNQSVSNLNMITTQFDELLKTVNQNPSVFVRGKAAPQPGPGE